MSFQKQLDKQRSYVPATKGGTLHKHPEGFEPQVTLDARGGGVISSGPISGDPRWADILELWDLSPEEFDVVPGTVEMTARETKDGVLRYWKARIVKKIVGGPNIDDVDNLVKKLWSRKVNTKAGCDYASTYVVTCADWQLGKTTQFTYDKFCEAVDDIVADFMLQKKTRKNLEHVMLLGLGDIIENCQGAYEMQTFEVDLNQRDQIMLAQNMIMKLVDTFAPLTGNLTIAAVGGNHGENRKGSKAFTNFADNWDVMVFEIVAEICSRVPAFGHVKFVLPNGELGITVNVHGNIVGLIHGHQCRGNSGATTAAKLWTWWQKQALGSTPCGDASILFVGHHHHFSLEAKAGRTLVMCPSIEEKSVWWQNATGETSMPAILTCVIDERGLSGVRLF